MAVDMKIIEQLKEEGVKYLKEFGYPDANIKNIMTVMGYQSKFISLIEKKYDTGINEEIAYLVNQIDDIREPKLRTVWITKFALTRGILEVQALGGHEGVITIPATKTSLVQYYHGNGREWHETLASAQAMAEHLRQKEISKLRAQLSKLEKMTFNENEVTKMGCDI